MSSSSPLHDFLFATLAGFLAAAASFGIPVLGLGWEGPGLGASVGGLLVVTLLSGALAVGLGRYGSSQGAVDWPVPYAVLVGLGGGLFLAGVEPWVSLGGAVLLLGGLVGGVKGQALKRERENRHTER